MFETINSRDPPDILCQIFFHIGCPGTGQTEGTIPYIHPRQSLPRTYTTALALYSIFNLSLINLIRNANAHTEWFSDNISDPSLSVLTTEMVKIFDSR